MTSFTSRSTPQPVQSLLGPRLSAVQASRARSIESYDQESSFGNKRPRLAVESRGFYIGPSIPEVGYGLTLVSTLNDAGFPIAAPVSYFDLGEDYTFDRKLEYDEVGKLSTDIILTEDIERYDESGKQLSDESVKITLKDQFSLDNQSDPDAKNLILIMHLIFKSGEKFKSLDNKMKSLISSHKIIKREFDPKGIALIASYVEGLHVNKQRSLGDIICPVYVNYQSQCWKVRDYGMLSNRFVAAFQTLKSKLYEYKGLNNAAFNNMIDDEHMALLVAKYIESDMVLNFMTKSEGYRLVDPKTKEPNVYIQSVDIAFRKILSSRYFLDKK